MAPSTLEVMTRELTDRERAVLTLMIDSAGAFADDPEPSDEARRRWRAQLAGARAGAACGCGTCPSIELENEHGHTPAGGRRMVLSASHPHASLLLFIDGDRLSYLELAPHGERPFPAFPPVAEITV